MSGAMREKDAADYDLERIIGLFDEALTSTDPRVKNALRQLMMITVLTSNEHEDRVQIHSHREGPLRRMQEDLRDMATRMHMFDEKIRRLEHDLSRVLNQPPTSYRGGFGGNPQWPDVFPNTGMGQAINEPGMNTNAISADDYWKQRGIVNSAKYQAQISENVLRDLNINVASTPKGLHKE